MKQKAGFFTTLVFVVLSITNSAMAESPQPSPKLATPISASDTAYPYQLFPTTNIWTHLLLETATGRVWQVQFSVADDAPSAKFEINNSSLLPQGAAPKSGRFTLYPTQNMFTFLLLDRQDSRMWQLQWSSDSEKRGIVRTINEAK